MSVNDEKKACRLGGGTLPSIYLCRITRREKVLVNRVRGYAWWCTGGEWRGFGSGGLDPIDHEASYTARPLQTLLAGATYFCSFKTEQKGEESSCSRTVPLPITLFSPIFVSRLVTLLPRAVHLSLSLSLSFFLLCLSLARRSLTGISNCEIRRVGNPMTGGSGFLYYFVNTLLPVLKSVSRIKNEMGLNKNYPVRKHKSNASINTLFSLFWMCRKYIKEMKLNLSLHFHLFLHCFV